MTWVLECSLSDGQTRRLPIADGQTIKIGRGTNSDTQIPDPALSRLHCELSVHGERFTLKDNNSSSGTFVSSDRIQECSLQVGQSFRAGNTLFHILGHSQLDEPTRLSAHLGHAKRLRSLAKELESAGELDRYRLLDALDEGGQNLVFKAEEIEGNREVAIKIFPDDHSTLEDDERFMRAMKSVQQLNAPEIIRLYRAGKKKDFFWVAMRWCPEGSLRDRVASLGIGGRLDWKDVWGIAVAISKSLVVLQKHGIVHRNVRPSNILRCPKHRCFVLSDLVAAKPASEEQRATVTGEIYLPSDLSYTAPERLLGTEGDIPSAKADIYSLGAVLAELLNGQPPFGRGSLGELLVKMRAGSAQIERHGQMGVNERFVDLVGRMTNPDPKHRPQTATELLSEIERIAKFSNLPV
ncbi:MAG: protein kinase [Planctomycetales bacterium]|nr:protein kinase [Planctomycetales bacterium]